MVFRLWLAFLVFSFGLSAVTPAQAQSVTPGIGLQRREGREQRASLTTITYEDCVAGGTDPANFDYLEVPLIYVGAQGKKLQVWAGASSDCYDDDSRVTLGDRCWQVYSGDLPTKVELSVRDILPHANLDTQTTEVCETATEDTLTLFFLLFEGSSSEDSQYGKLAIEYDLVGPSAPTGLSLAEGEERLFASWDDADTETEDFRVYCEEAVESSGAGGNAGNATGGSGTATSGGTASGGSADNAAGNSDDAAGSGGSRTSGGSSSSGGSTSGAAGCAAENLRADMRPDDRFRRGSTGSESTKVQADGLTNYVRYACGVAAVDEYSNVGPLSGLRCATPEAVTDYFEAYREAGGQGGGGFCSFGRKPLASWSLLALVALGLCARRLRRPRSAA